VSSRRRFAKVVIKARVIGSYLAVIKFVLRPCFVEVEKPGIRWILASVLLDELGVRLVLGYLEAVGLGVLDLVCFHLLVLTHVWLVREVE